MSHNEKLSNIESVLPLLGNKPSGYKFSLDIVFIAGLVFLFALMLVIFLGLFNEVSTLIFLFSGALLFTVGLISGSQIVKSFKIQTPQANLEKKSEDREDGNQKQEFLSFFLEQLPYPVFYITGDDRLDFLNEGARQFLGLGKKASKKLSYRDVFGSDGMLVRLEKRNTQSFEEKSINLPESISGNKASRLIFLDPSPHSSQSSQFSL